MTITAKSYKIRNSRLVQPSEVESTGSVGVLMAEELNKIHKEMEIMKTTIEQQKALLQQVASNTKYPLKPYTVDDFEAMFGLKKNSQLNYRKAGKLGFIKLGETVLYTQQHIKDFIELHDSTNQKKNN
jgi:hypothetical protein